MTRAFTLVEQLAAVALASLFMLAGFSVLGRVAHVRNSHAAVDEARALSRIADLMEWDLTQARRFRTDSTGVVLSGFGSMDVAMNPTHRPARIEYRVVREGDATRLVRRQDDLDVLSNRAKRVIWVSDDVARIDVTPLTRVRPTTRPSGELFGPDDGLAVAEVMKLVIIPGDPKAPAVVRICRLR